MVTTRGVGLALAAVVAVAAGTGCGGGSKQPNVILISIDMLRPDHLGCYGYRRQTSPNLDRIATEGVVYRNHIASSSWTLPSHASIFTSLPDSLHGCTDTDRSLAPSATTLAERFQAAGYATAGFFAGPYLHPAFGLGQGFDHYEDCASYAARIDDKPPSDWAMDKEIMVQSHEDVTNGRVYDAVKRWMGGKPDKPFFLFVHLWDVHFDFVPPPPWDTKFDPGYDGWVDGRNFFFDERYGPGMADKDFKHLLALYDGEIAWTDSILGKLREDLEKAGILDGTVLAITSTTARSSSSTAAKATARPSTTRWSASRWSFAIPRNSTQRGASRSRPAASTWGRPCSNSPVFPLRPTSSA
jgi:arylsulfatase A-like enzyme